MGNNSVLDSSYSLFGADPSAAFASVVSPASADSIVGPPPDGVPDHQPGQGTPLTGNLAAAPKQAVAKNLDTQQGRSAYTGVSNPPNGGFGATTSVQPAQVMRPAQTVQPAQNGLQPAVYKPGVPLAAQQASRVQAYNAGPGPAQYAASQTPASTDMANPDPAASMRPGGTSPMMPAILPAQPGQSPIGLQPVQGPSQLDKDQNKLNMLTNSGSGVSQIKNPFLRGLARVGDVAGSILAPGVAAAIPGTTLHHQQLLGQQQAIVGNDQAQQQAEAQTADTNQQTAQRAATAAKETAQAGANVPRPVTADEARAAGNPALEGSVMRPSDIGKVAVQGVKNVGQIDKDDDPDSYQAKNAQSLEDVRQTQQVLNQAKADAENADPKTPAGRMAIAKLRAAEDGHSAAMVRAQASMINAQAGAFGTYNGKALPGAMVTDQGTPVGSHFQSNVRPTGAERGKADMAASAEEQLGDIKKIMQRHPTLFGPGYGQETAFKNWVGSQDADAQRFKAARTIAGDHLAGTFGGRSEAALSALDDAIGKFKDNPKAAIAGIDQLTKANVRFKQAGTVKTVGSNAAKALPAPAAPPSKGGFNWDSHPLVRP